MSVDGSVIDRDGEKINPMPRPKSEVLGDIWLHRLSTKTAAYLDQKLERAVITEAPIFCGVTID